MKSLCSSVRAVWNLGMLAVLLVLLVLVLIYSLVVLGVELEAVKRDGTARNRGSGDCVGVHFYFFFPSQQTPIYLSLFTSLVRPTVFERCDLFATFWGLLLSKPSLLQRVSMYPGCRASMLIVNVTIYNLVAGYYQFK